MNRCFLLPNACLTARQAGKADTFCFFADPYSFGILTQQKVSKNASFHKAIAKHRSFSNQNAFSIADGEVKFEI